MGAFRVEAGHPCLPGHFPGCPVVPGVVLLDEAMAHATPAGAGLAGFDAVKFLRPVLPGEAVEVLAGPAAGDRLPFACTVGGEAAVRGTALLLSAPQPDARLPDARLSGPSLSGPPLSDAPPSDAPPPDAP